MNQKFFSESVKFNEDEREEAKTYLESWKKFLLRRLKRDSFHLKLLDEVWGERPAHLDGCLNFEHLMFLKLAVMADWDYCVGEKRIESCLGRG